MKHSVTVFLFLSLFVSCLFSQDSFKRINQSPRTGQSGCYYSNGSGDLSNPVISPVPPPKEQFSAEKEMLLKKLRAARKSGDNKIAKEIQNRLDELDGKKQSASVSDPLKTYLPLAQTDGNLPPPYNSEPDILFSNLGNGPYMAVATQTSHRTNTIFVAATEFVSGAYDLLKVWTSTNGGSTFNLRYSFVPVGPGVRFRADELDIEPIIFGQDTMLFCVAGINYNGHAYTRIYRVNMATGILSGTEFTFGGYFYQSNNNYNPRITSDNSIFDYPYVYVSVTADSLLQSGNKISAQRFAVIYYPLANNWDLTYMTPMGSNNFSGFYWYSSSIPAGTYVWQDICYYRDGGTDRIYSVYTDESGGFGTAWSEDYGNSNAGNLLIIQAPKVSSARISSNDGYNGIKSMCIAYRKIKTGSTGDWDFYGMFTSTGGLTSGSWTQKILDEWPDTVLTVDVQGKKNTNGTFALAYTISNRTYGHWFVQAQGSGASFSNFVQTNNELADLSHGGTKAGYYNGNASDSSFVIWLNNAYQARCSRNLFNSSLPQVRLLLPANNSINVGLTSMLDWADTSSINLHQVQVSTSSSFSSTVVDTTVLPSYIVVPAGKLNYSTLYYWRVKGWSGTFQGPWSSIWNFTTGNMPPPTQAPVLVSPPNGITNLGLAPQMTWNSVANASYYKFMVSSDLNFSNSSIVIDTTTAQLSYTFTMGHLNYLSKYYWKVFAGNTGGLGPTSEIWNFTTQSMQQVVLQSPQNNYTSNNPNITFRWNPMQYIEGFVFQIAYDINFNNIYFSNNNVLADSILISGLPNNQYWWKVCAKGNAGQGPWSEIRSVIINSIGVTNLSTEIPKEYKLYNNYPNPFNPVTNIKFDLPKSSNVKLAVYDIQGRQIEILVNEKLSAGVYKADFNAGRLPSGVYFYRLTTGDYTATKRMILIK